VTARGYGKGPRLTCPDCKRKGVTLRLNTSEDHWGCRYCDWYTFTSGSDAQDMEARAALEEANPGDYEAGG
jgi:ribosomal protein L37AE/L43A